jgi:hypothetical protein
LIHCLPFEQQHHETFRCKLLCCPTKLKCKLITVLVNELHYEHALKCHYRHRTTRTSTTLAGRRTLGRGLLLSSTDHLAGTVRVLFGIAETPRITRQYRRVQYSVLQEVVVSLTGEMWVGEWGYVARPPDKTCHFKGSHTQLNADPIKTNRNTVKIIFLPMIRHIRGHPFAARLSYENCIKISIEHWWTGGDRANPKFSEKNLSSCHFCNH